MWSHANWFVWFVYQGQMSHMQTERHILVYSRCLGTLVLLLASLEVVYNVKTWRAQAWIRCGVLHVFQINFLNFLCALLTTYEINKMPAFIQSMNMQKFFTFHSELFLLLFHECSFNSLRPLHLARRWPIFPEVPFTAPNWILGSPFAPCIGHPYMDNVEGNSCSCRGGRIPTDSQAEKGLCRWRRTLVDEWKRIISNERLALES